MLDSNVCPNCPIRHITAKVSVEGIKRAKMCAEHVERHDYDRGIIVTRIWLSYSPWGIEALLCLSSYCTNIEEWHMELTFIS